MTYAQHFSLYAVGTGDMNNTDYLRPSYDVTTTFCNENVKGFSDNRLIKRDKESIDKIFNLQSIMEDMPSTLDQFELTHHFAPGCYAREMALPKGNVIIGKIHKHAHLNILQKGKVSVSTEDGNKEMTAPCVFTSYAGTKRAVYVIEDAIWITIHVTDKTNLDDIEAEIIAKDFDELEEGNMKLGESQ